MNKGSFIERSESEAQALDVWLDFLGRASSSENDDAGFERLCNQRPDLASELRKLRLQALPDVPSGIGSSDGQEPPRPFEERLRELAKPILRGGRFRREGVIARGGMGVIHRVRDVELNRVLALKEMILGSAELNSMGAARFLEEAQVTAQLDHPGIVPIHEVGLDARGSLYFAMKLVQGRDLKAILDLVRAGSEGWTQARALGVLLKVCEAMAYAHSKGVIHRDLKPGNVMVGHFGEVYVMDWGLARVMGRQDVHDIRLKLGDVSQSVRTERREEREDTPDSPLVTMDGDVVGTPAYMPPEQARGEIQLLSPRSDVYSIGAMLYHLLSGQTPYVPTGARVSKHAVLFRVIEGPPAPILELNPDIPAELVAICEQAMARVSGERYPDTLALGDDLRAYLEGRVVRAYETGAVAELRKWVGRNQGLAAASAAAVLALVAGLVVSLVLKAQSDRNEDRALAGEALAEDNEALAVIEKSRADRVAKDAKQTADELLSLSALQTLDDLVLEADRLWPAHPAILESDWLTRAENLVAELPRYEAKLIELRAKAHHWTEEERAAQLVSHPKLPHLKSTQMHLEFLRERKAALTSGQVTEDPTPEEAGVDFSVLPQDPEALNNLAWNLVYSEGADWSGAKKGLVLARRAVTLETYPAKRSNWRNTLSWALFANGRLEEAMAEGEGALEEVDEEKRGEYDGYAEALRFAIDEELSSKGIEEADQELADLEDAIAGLELEISARREWRFDSNEDRWWHNQLEKLVDGLKALADPYTGLVSKGISEQHGWGMKRRLEFASTIQERSLSGSEAAARWAEAIASIQDPAQCPRYGDLRISPQLGLLPIGRDPDSGWWEFAHLQTGELAQRGPDGKLVLREETGLVLVLLPGGAFSMGAGMVPYGTNFDPVARPGEFPMHAVTLSPFFLSKYEMTQAQWQRFTSRNPSRYHLPNRFVSSLLHPVEQVSWATCKRTMERLGLVLPSEAQWEYGARGGTRSVWWTGNEQGSLVGAVNLVDRAAKRANVGALAVRSVLAEATKPVNVPFDAKTMDDGCALHSPVDHFRPNPFGLHNVHGNVMEWCLDGFDENFYWKSPEQDPIASPTGAPNCVGRGGSFASAPTDARSARRNPLPPDYANGFLGLRPAKNVTP